MERGHPQRFLQGCHRRAGLGSLLQPPAPISGPPSEGWLWHAAWDLLGGLFAWFLLIWTHVQPSLIPWDPSLSRAPRYVGMDLNPHGQSLSRPCPCPLSSAAWGQERGCRSPCFAPTSPSASRPALGSLLPSPASPTATQPRPRALGPPRPPPCWGLALVPAPAHADSPLSPELPGPCTPHQTAGTQSTALHLDLISVWKCHKRHDNKISDAGK